MNVNWPNDSDGDVLRVLESEGFDFSNKVKIDSNINFDHWPLEGDEIKSVLVNYPNAKCIDLIRKL